MNRLTTKLITSALAGGCLLAATSSPALDVYLRAEAFTKPLPGKNVLMWGFAEDTDQDFSTVVGEDPSVPGPQINVPDTDTTLVIHLKNNLTVPVSIVIPNQNGFLIDGSPTITPDAQGRPRARSLVKETAAGAEVAYQWNNLTPGTYVYYSGSQPALQVQMGLYGAMVRKASATEIYPGQGADSEQLVLFSEIDSKVHDAVQNLKYGPWTDTVNPPPADWVFSTIRSVPDYFLINGESYTPPESPTVLSLGTAGQTSLLRMVNASINTRIPVVYGLDQKIIAEDGRPYTYPRTLVAPDVPALKTMDVMVTAAEGTYPLYDRSLGLVNGMQAPGGMLVHLQVGAAPAP